MKLSIIIPVFNESTYLDSVVNRVLSQKLEKINSLEIIIVDDGSSDGTSEIIERFCRANPNTISGVRHNKNMGKGASVELVSNAQLGTFVSSKMPILNITPKIIKSWLHQF